MKPHEEEWYQSIPGTVRVRALGTGRNGALVAQVATAPREVLILAAPNMARALLELVDDRTGHVKWCGGCCESECTDIVSALKKAGVL